MRWDKKTYEGQIALGSQDGQQSCPQLLALLMNLDVSLGWKIRTIPILELSIVHQIAFSASL